MLKFFKIREICDENPFYSNNSFSIKLTRFFIRIIQNIFNLSLAVKILLTFDKLLNFFIYSISPVRYIFLLNAHRLSYLSSLSRNNLFQSIDEKIKWCQFIIRESSCSNSKVNANAFIELVQKDNLHIDRFKLEDLNLPKFTLDTNFLIVGPNYKNINYSNQNLSLIHLKPFSSDLIGFKEKILVLNSFYYRNKVMKDSKFSKLLTESYDFIFVSCSTSVLKEGYYRLPVIAGGNIASLMGLQRILLFLTILSPLNKKIKVQIDGFDSYLSKNSYSNSSYEKLNHNELKPSMDEKLICLALAHHDFTYNFCFLKKISLSFDIMGTSDFKNVLSNSLYEYINKLSCDRDFTTII